MKRYKPPVKYRVRVPSRLYDRPGIAVRHECMREKRNGQEQIIGSENHFKSILKRFRVLLKQSEYKWSGCLIRLLQGGKMMVKSNTKQMRSAYERFLVSMDWYLEDVYSSYSQAKRNAYEYCRDLYNKYNGERFRIVSFNQNVFTVGFIGTIEGHKAFFYITRDYDRYMFID